MSIYFDFHEIRREFYTCEVGEARILGCELGLIWRLKDQIIKIRRKEAAISFEFPCIFSKRNVIFMYNKVKINY